MGKLSKRFKSYLFPSSASGTAERATNLPVEDADEATKQQQGHTASESSPLLQGDGTANANANANANASTNSGSPTQSSNGSTSSWELNQHRQEGDGQQRKEKYANDSANFSSSIYDTSLSYRVASPSKHKRNNHHQQLNHHSSHFSWKRRLHKVLHFAGFLTLALIILVLTCGGIDRVFHEPLVWSMLVMLTIVSLLLAWEETVHMIRHALPQALTPVVDSILAEMSGLGFVGLLLHTGLMGGVLEPYIEHISEEFLGEGDILIESFEFLHEIFFQVGVGFFIVSGLAVGDVLLEIKRLSEISRLSLDSDGDGEVTLDELADALKVEAMIVDSNNDGEIDEEEITEALRASHRSTLWEQCSMTRAQVGAEVLVMRERLLRQYNLPKTFEIERYFEHTFGKNLEQMVEMSPLTWLPLIPLLALTNGIDLHKSIVSAASENASEACGEFLSNPLVFGTITAVQIGSVLWGLFNFWKLAQIKSYLVPTLVRDGSATGPAVLLPPRYLDPALRQEFYSSPWIVSLIEKMCSRGLGSESNTDAEMTPQEQLWGAAGMHGPVLYRNSIKFHAWLCVTVIVYLGSQIVMRDIRALWWHDEVLGASKSTVIAETCIYGFFVAISLLQLALAPKTFLYYSYVTSIEEQAQDWAMEAAMQDIALEQHQTETHTHPVRGAAITTPDESHGHAGGHETHDRATVEC